MKIFVAGSWHKNLIKRLEKEIEIIGRLVAESKSVLITGGGTGVSEIVANAYLKAGGKKHIVYDVALRFRKSVGEKRKIKAHRTIKTGEDYPIRNNVMVRNCDLMIVFSGRLGVLGEILNAVNDYDKKVIIFEKEFKNLNCVKKILSDAGKNRKVFYIKNINEIKKFILNTNQKK